LRSDDVLAVTRQSSALILLPVVGLLVGCNSTDGLHSQGPWGPPEIRRSYPQYSSPWGRRMGEERPVAISGAGYSFNADLSPSSGGALSAPQDYRRESGLPADPEPAARVTASRLSNAAEYGNVTSPNSQYYHTTSPGDPLAESPPGVFSTPRRASSYAGTWKATDGAGRSCLVHLSSVASLDLYKASISKCSDDLLRQVNLWKFEGNQISLVARGTEIARLEGSEASLTGFLSQSGAPLKMLR